MRVPIDSISPHPRNYRGHPPEQIEQIRASVRQFGQYREVVTSSDSVILCGQGVWEALKAEGHETVETHPMDFAHDDPRAEKLLIADNELSKLAIDDEKALAALLADIQRQEGGLSGTGWDDGALDKLIGTLAAEDFAGGQAPLVGRPDATNTATRQVGLWEERDRVVVTLGDFATAFVPRQAARDAGQIVADHFQSDPAEAVATLIEGLANGSVGLC